MIYKSDNINELALALSNFQGEVHDVYKGSKGYGYDYADLSAVFEVIRPLLKKHGLSVTQPVSGNNNMIDLNTIVMHSSGQYLSSMVSIPVDMTNKKMNSLQAAGSTITYMRRYCLCSVLGLATTDDDGKAGGEDMDNNKLTGVKHAASTPPVKNVSQAMQQYKSNISYEELEMLRNQLTVRIIEDQIPSSVVETWCSRANVQSINQFDYQQIINCLGFLDRRKKKNETESLDDIVSKLSEE